MKFGTYLNLIFYTNKKILISLTIVCFLVIFH